MSKAVFCAMVLMTCSVYTAAQDPSHADSLSEAARKADKPADKINALLELSRWLISTDFPQAVALAEKNIATADSLNDEKLKADALTTRALLYWYDGEYPPSINLSEQAIALRQPLGDIEGIAHNHFRIAMNYYYMADYPDAIQFHQLAEKGFKEAGNVRQQATTLNLIGLVYHQMGNYPQTIRYLQEFSKVRQSFEGYQGRTYNMGSTTPFFRQKDFFETELNLQLKALQQLEKSKEKERLLLTYLNIADTYKELENFPQALVYHKKAARFAETIGQMPRYNYLANAYRAAGHPDSAWQIHTTFLKFCEEKGTQLDVLEAQINLGKDLIAMNQKEKALAHYLEALRITTRMGNKLDMVINNYRIVQLLMDIGRTTDALRHSEAAVQMAEKIHSVKWQRDAYELHARVLAALNDYAKAYHYQAQYKVMADSLLAGEADLQFAQTQIQFEVDKKLEEIEALSQSKALQEERLANKDKLIAASLMVLTLALMLFMSLWMRYRQKNKVNSILTQQKQQIETLMSEVHHRVKNNLQIISSLLSIQSDQLKNEDARLAVLEGQNRVQAMGLIHENIYKTENFAYIDMKVYVEKLCYSLVRSFGLQPHDITIKTAIENLSLDVDTAIQLGLIINELVTNSMKHAFREITSPAISIHMYQQDELLCLELSDNGIGLKEMNHPNSFGLRLVKELADQLKGTLQLYY